jgi:hypothetical protein
MTIVLKYLSVYILSGVKFIFGPALGVVAYDLPLFAVIILTSLGMMTTVYVITFFGDFIRGIIDKYLIKEKKTFTSRNRRFVKLWTKFGLKGVCLLTPLILTPAGGGLLINVLESKKSLIIKWMWISAIFWSTVICLLISYVEGFSAIIQRSL